MCTFVAFNNVFLNNAQTVIFNIYFRLIFHDCFQFWRTNFCIIPNSHLYFRSMHTFYSACTCLKNGSWSLVPRQPSICSKNFHKRRPEALKLPQENKVSLQRKFCQGKKIVLDLLYCVLLKTSSTKQVTKKIHWPLITENLLLVFGSIW